MNQATYQLTPKAPEDYQGGSDKELYDMLRQCIEYSKFVRVCFDNQGSVAFAISFLSGGSVGPVWDASAGASLEARRFVRIRRGSPS